MSVILDPYHAVDQTVGWVDRTDRVRLQVTGPDRVRFLQNLTTNDVRKVDPGHGCETFVTTPQGKTLALVTLHADEDRLLLRADPDAREGLLPHLEKYGIFDDVTLTDSSSRSYEIHLLGPRVLEVLDRLQVDVPPLENDLRHGMIRLLDRSAWLIREAPTGRPGVTLIGDRQDWPLVADLVREAGESSGLVEVNAATFDVLRIEAGTPVFGRDLTIANLPQELDRDSHAISFTKGCYLGQETVARIDALGHVNKLLRGLRFDPGNVPDPGTTLEVDGKSVGAVTSSGISPKFSCPVGLGYVRRAHSALGQAVEFTAADGRRHAVVVALPMVTGPGADRS